MTKYRTTSAFMGIYVIENLATGQVYVGQTISGKKRLSQHKGDLRANRHFNTYLQHAWNLYGSGIWKFHFIEEIFDCEKLNKREIYWIHKLQSDIRELGYNIETGGKSGTVVSEETREKMSLHMMGNQRGKGQIFTKERRRRISLANTGKVVSEDTKKKLSKRNKDRFKNLEEREKTSKATKAAMYRPEVQTKLRKPKGPLSLERRKQMSEQLTGIPKPPRSEEHRKNMSDSMRKSMLKRYPSDRFKGLACVVPGCKNEPDGMYMKIRKPICKRHRTKIHYEKKHGRNPDFWNRPGFKEMLVGGKYRIFYDGQVYGNQ